MNDKNNIKIPAKQKGLVLVVLVIIIVLAFVSYIVGELSISEIKTERELKTTQALKKAKQALLAYAMNYPDTLAGLGNTTQGPGNFPCPDDDRDGDSDNPGVVPGCNSLGDGTMGRFPWSEVGIDELRDGSGELLWYAVSSTFVNAADRMVNTSSVGAITLRNIDGTIRFDGTGIDGVIAVIIAPGETLLRNDALLQSRVTPAELDDPRNYLDIALGEDNAVFQNTDADGFIVGEIFDVGNNVIVNDQIEVITYDDIMPLVHARAFSDIRNVLTNYKANCLSYPDASFFNPMKADNLFDSDPAPTYQGYIPTDDSVIPEPATVTPINWNTLPCAAGINLPNWFEGEDWKRETYFHFSTSNPNPCIGANCLVVNNTTPAVNAAEAIIVFSGRDLNAVRPVNDITQYYEGENNNNDNIYDAAQGNDYVGVIEQ